MSSTYTFHGLIDQLYNNIIVDEINKFLRENPFFDIAEDDNFVLEAEYVTDVTPKYFCTESFDEPFKEFRIAYHTNLNSLTRFKTDQVCFHDSTYAWFTVVCSCELNDGIKNFKVLKVENYEKGMKAKSVFSDTLVPLIKHTDYEKLAEKFLSKYNPTALNGKKVDVNKIVSSLGLNVKEAILSKDGSILGQISFFETSGKVYDPVKKRNVKKVFPAKTILIDTIALNERSEGSKNIAIIHECIHWYLHRYSIELRRIFDASYTHLVCTTLYKLCANDETSIMEAQARGIAPKVLTPKQQFIIKAKEFIDENQNFRLNILKKFYKAFNLEIHDDPIYSMDLVIIDLSKHFKISKLAAKIRLAELGFSDAKGSLIYMDGGYVPCHKTSNDSLGLHETFAVPLQQFNAMIRRSDHLNKLLLSGKFVYVNNFVCINHPKFIRVKDQTVELTPYARTHMEECCLVFQVDFEKYKEYHRKDQYLFLYSDKGCDELPLRFAINRQINLIEEGLVYAKEINYINEFKSCSSFKATFEKVFEDARKSKNIKVDVMARELQIDNRTLLNYRKGDIPSLEVLLAMCLYIGFTGFLISLIVKKSKFNYDSDNNNHSVYEYVATTYGGHPYKEICKFISELKANPLI